MRAEFFREDDAAEPVAVATWEQGAARVESDEPTVREALARVFRSSPVTVDEPAAQDPAAGGSAVVQPGDLTWFRTAALVRGRAEGLRVRLVTDTPGGWDPAGAYRSLEAWTVAREGNEPPRGLGTSRA